jgi:hypothetical protein
MIKDSISRYINTPIKLNEDRYHYILYQKPRIPESSSDKYHIVEPLEANRLDLIANKYYENSNLWWMIALANNIIDPSIILEGRLLRIPSQIDVLNAIQSLRYR